MSNRKVSFVDRPELIFRYDVTFGGETGLLNGVWRISAIDT